MTPTDAGLDFFRQAQVVLRHADDAVRAAQRRRLSGHVSVGLVPTTASVLGLPLVQAMRKRYPDVRLHLMEALSGHPAGMLETRRVDLAIVVSADAARRWSVLPLLRERLFVMASAGLPGAAALAAGAEVQPADLAGLPLMLPTGPLRAAPLARAGGRDYLLARLNDDGLSAAALAARVTVAEVAP